MRPAVVVVILPLAQLLVRELNVIRDAVLVQELIELLVIHAVRSFDFGLDPIARRFSYAT
jgi:hypothetical protein